MTTLSHGRGWLADDAAASLHRVDARLGRPLDVNWAGRTYAEQLALWRKYGSPRAAYPGTSTHEKGRSIDTDDRISWLGEHGWVANVRNEPWHFEYFASKDQHRFTPTPSTKKEDEIMFINVQGTAGKRRGGCYYISGNVATFLGGVVAGLPTLPSAQADALATRVAGL